jgi:hypothetical protein
MVLLPDPLCPRTNVVSPAGKNKETLWMATSSDLVGYENVTYVVSTVPIEEESEVLPV